MFVTHLGKTPQVHPSAWVAPDATLCGDVEIGPDCRIGFGARLISEGAPLRVGQGCIVMENAVLRAPEGHPLSLGPHSLVGPQAHLAGCQVADRCFIATGAAVFHGARLGTGTEVRIHATVHLKTVLAPGSTVPIGWVAVGDPAQILPPQEHDAIWALQAPLNFPETVYGVDRTGADPMQAITQARAVQLGRHGGDQIVG